MYKRPIYDTIIRRLYEPKRFIQAIIGPRQVGKTTLAHQIKESISLPLHYASADEATLKDTSWIEQQWEIGRLRTKGSSSGAVLVLDEVQKIPNWSNIIKKLWDSDNEKKIKLKVAILGSSSLLIEQGLTESLAGRFEIIPITHWSLAECKTCFGWSPEKFIYFGGYPGPSSLIADEMRWSRYIIDALIETTISKDIMLMTRIHKPAILRRLFELGCSYSGQILSYQKMMGQLQDAGNATTLAHYLTLLCNAGLLTGLQKFASEDVRQKASSPKLQVMNTALITAQQTLSFEEMQENREVWGRLVESAIGAYLVNSTLGTKIKVFYWRDGNKEVDFILQKGDRLIAIEVKSGEKKATFPGIDAFAKQFPVERKLLVGGQGITIEEFLLRSPEFWFN